MDNTRLWKVQKKERQYTNLTVADIEWCWQKPSQLVLFALVVQRQIEILLQLDVGSMSGVGRDDN